MRNEISVIGQKFQTTGLKREELESIILTFPQMLEHLLKKNLSKNPSKSRQKEMVNRIKNEIFEKISERSFTGVLIANSQFTLDVKQTNGRIKKFIARNPEDKITSWGSTTAKIIESHNTNYCQ